MVGGDALRMAKGGGSTRNMAEVGSGSPEEEEEEGGEEGEEGEEGRGAAAAAEEEMWMLPERLTWTAGDEPSPLRREDCQEVVDAFSPIEKKIDRINVELSGRLIYIIIAVFINLMLMVPGIIESMRAIGKTSVHGICSLIIPVTFFT